MEYIDRAKPIIVVDKLYEAKIDTRRARFARRAGRRRLAVRDEETDSDDDNNVHGLANRIGAVIIDGNDPDSDVDNDNEHNTDSDNDDQDVENDVENDNQNYDEMFWDIISKFNWRNLSDGVISPAIIRAVVSGYDRHEIVIFADKYREYYDRLYNMLKDEGMKYRIEGPDDKLDKIASHFVAMGREVYAGVLEQPEFCEFLAGECQSLAEIIADQILNKWNVRITRRND
jgi:hypothetical protein